MPVQPNGTSTTKPAVTAIIREMLPPHGDGVKAPVTLVAATRGGGPARASRRASRPGAGPVPYLVQRPPTESRRNRSSGSLSSYAPVWVSATLRNRFSANGSLKNQLRYRVGTPSNEIPLSS